MGRQRKGDGNGTGAKMGFEEKLWAASDREHALGASDADNSSQK